VAKEAVTNVAVHSYQVSFRKGSEWGQVNCWLYQGRRHAAALLLTCPFWPFDLSLLAFSVASGNQWRDQELADCLKAVERMGIEKQVKVNVGSQYPILHDYNDYLYEEQLFGPPIDYVGAYSAPPPNPKDLVPPPDGFATHTVPAKNGRSRLHY